MELNCTVFVIRKSVSELVLINLLDSLQCPIIIVLAVLYKFLVLLTFPWEYSGV